MELSKRLEAVIAMAEPGNCAADIGTDHGFVPVAMVQRGLFKKALAMDVRPGPLQGAALHIREAGLEEQIETRLSDGLDRLLPGEADTLIMAGMGGPLMSSLLERGTEAAHAVSQLILSPQSDIPSFRQYLQEHGYRIEAEQMLEEEDKYYVIFRAAPGQQKAWSEEEYRFGKYLLESASPVLRQWLEKKLDTYDKILRQLRDKGGEGSAARIQIIEEEKAAAEKVLRSYWNQEIRRTEI